MPPRKGRFSESELEFIEEAAQQMAFFRHYLIEQCDVARSDPSEWQAALVRFDGGKHGPQRVAHNWFPAEDQIESYLTNCETICRREINSLDDRVIVQHAAHAGLVSLITFKISTHPNTKISLAINKRVMEIAAETEVPYSALPVTLGSPLTPPATPSSRIAERATRSLTPEEITRCLASFDFLGGKQFILNPDTADETTYRVGSFCAIRRQYEIMFDDNPDDFIKVEIDELRRMLNGSKIYTYD